MKHRKRGWGFFQSGILQARYDAQMQVIRFLEEVIAPDKDMVPKSILLKFIEESKKIIDETTR